MEILNPAQYNEYEQFVKTHENGSFMQSLNWHKVKNNWGLEVVVSRDDNGKIKGSVLILVQKILFWSLLYAPRGPVCDFSDKKTITDLVAGIKEVAKKHNAHTFKMDPDVLATNTEFIQMCEDLGFIYDKGGDNFETIQPRFNYRLSIAGKSEEELFANLTQKTRYNVRVAQKHNVEIKVCSKEHLDDFVRLMATTGERDGFSVRPRSYFEKMLDAFGEDVRLYMGFYEGRAISGAITTNYAGKTCYVYGASDNMHRNVMPNYLMQWEMIKWAIEQNATLYDFQGVSGVLDESNPLYGLYRFKKGFNGELVELAGEFNIFFKPTIAKMIDFAIDVREKLYKFKKKLKRK